MSNPPRQNPYAEAGVDAEKGDRLVDWLVAGTQQMPKPKRGVAIAGIGGFAALFRPNFEGLEEPLLIASTDGVGTKVLLGIESAQLHGLGIDLVAMCVNDLYTVGGRPLFFLDYYATGALDEEQFKGVLAGIRDGCAAASAALIGGETAEMPGLYHKGHFDLAGFIVGVVDGKKMLGPTRVRPHDRLYALASSGFHSNGYSLLRRWLERAPTADLPRFRQELLTPTRIYHEIPELLVAMDPERFHALAHITGGGISGNLPRVLPPETVAHIELSALPTPTWMRDFIEANGETIASVEGIFNLGCGMIACVAAEAGAEFEALAAQHGLAATAVGSLASGVGPPRVEFH